MNTIFVWIFCNVIYTEWKETKPLADLPNPLKFTKKYSFRSIWLDETLNKHSIHHGLWGFISRCYMER